MFDEGFLQGMEVLGLSQPFDRGDPVAFMHDREREARIDAHSVHDHRARPALAVVAALLGAGQAEMLAQGIEKRCAGIELKAARIAVHLERHPGSTRRGFLVFRLRLRLSAGDDADHGCRRPGGEKASSRYFQAGFWHVFTASFSRVERTIPPQNNFHAACKFAVCTPLLGQMFDYFGSARANP
jgi:hypothetical protein